MWIELERRFEKETRRKTWRGNLKEELKGRFATRTGNGDLRGALTRGDEGEICGEVCEEI